MSFSSPERVIVERLSVWISWNSRRGSVPPGSLTHRQPDGSNASTYMQLHCDGGLRHNYDVRYTHLSNTGKKSQRAVSGIIRTSSLSVGINRFSYFFFSRETFSTLKEKDRNWVLAIAFTSPRLVRYHIQNPCPIGRKTAAEQDWYCLQRSKCANAPRRLNSYER